MRWYVCCSLLVFLLGGNSRLYAQSVTETYIEKYRPLAQQLSDSFGIPATLILAVAIVESGAGTSRNCRVLRNHFGIKAGKQLRTINGYRTRYRYYETDSLSFVDFCNYLQRRKFYVLLKGNFNYNAWLNAMAKSGYSGSPAKWKQKIRNTIQRYHLNEPEEQDARGAQQ